MIAWIVILAIVTLLFLISQIPIKITIEYNEELRAYWHILYFIHIPVTHQKEKKIKASDYSKKAIIKRSKQAEQKTKKTKKRKEENKKRRKELLDDIKNAQSLTDNINTIIDIVKVLFKRFFKHLRVDMSRIRISIVGEDAAQTAIMYGVVCQSVSYLLELIQRIKTVSPPDLDDVSVIPDWVGEKTKVDIKIAFSLRLGNILDIFFRVIGRIISHMFRIMKKNHEKHSPSSSNRKLPAKKPGHHPPTSKSAEKAGPPSHP